MSQHLDTQSTINLSPVGGLTEREDDEISPISQMIPRTSA